MKICFSALLGTMLFFTSCSAPDNSVADQTADVVSPVQVTGITHMPLAEYIEFTAISSYQQKSYVKANINGYVQFINASVGSKVTKGTVLFRLITKEAKAIGNAINKLDPGFQFSGVSAIRADQPGYITTVSHQKGDYVQDGEALAVISNQSSFAFLLDLPYEFNQLAVKGQSVELVLPDGKTLSGTITGSLPTVDSLAQTQRMIIKLNAAASIPEGLVARARLVKTSSPNAQVLPKSAVLTNETEDEFWVMKMINDSTAVKIPVKKGIENAKFIEVISPEFNLKDKIVSVGNYGIADTAKVKLLK
ncbi:efflux RND transporter periplasmic adaptor subunit [Pedobacter sp. UYP24]